jgi:hypothetical protein
MKKKNRGSRRNERKNGSKGKMHENAKWDDIEMHSDNV